MMVDTSDLIDVKSIAESVGVRSSAVSNWQARDPLFPQPVWTNGKWSLWLNWQVDAWLRATNRI